MIQIAKEEKEIADCGCFVESFCDCRDEEIKEENEFYKELITD